MCARRRGFTLLELLAVVAIVALLLGLLIPVLGRARSAARQVKCASNLHQYGIGFHFYFEENNDIFPVTDYGRHPSLPRTKLPPFWFQLIDAYWLGGLEEDPNKDSARGRRFGLGHCPEIRDLPIAGEHWEWDYTAKRLGYGYNHFWLGVSLGEPLFIGEVTTRRWRPLITVRQPAECLLIADSPIRGFRAEGQAHSLGWALIAAHKAGVHTRHGATGRLIPAEYRGKRSLYPDGVGNICWVDAHVSARETRQVNDVVGWRRLWDPEQGVGGW